jgi:hypothetical protein
MIYIYIYMYRIALQFFSYLCSCIQPDDGYIAATRSRLLAVDKVALGL